MPLNPHEDEEKKSYSAVYLVMVFVVLWLAWLGAVKFTEPKTAQT